MARDAMQSSHPIEVVVHHPDEVDQIFDSISYAKGASLVRMLYECVGANCFYRALHDYLTHFSYANATTEDLWRFLERASGLQITAMAHSWTSQTGYPVLSVVEEPQQDGSVVVKLRQKRFFADKAMKDDLVESSDEGPLAASSLWDVPLTVLRSTHPTSIQSLGIWRAKSSSESPVAASDDDGGTEATALSPLDTTAFSEQLRLAKGEWLLLNPRQSGFYLVKYPAHWWQALQTPVRTQQLDVVDRMGLLNSMFAFAKSGMVSLADLLAFTRAYVHEREFLCWKELSHNLRFYCALFGDDVDVHPKLQAYVRELYHDVFPHLTWDAAVGESDVTAQFRRDVIGMLAERLCLMFGKDLR